MAELHNPLFEDEKEFLERQKLEYERALLGDVDHIKAKTKQVSKIALIGAGVAGGVWLLAKAFGGKSRKKSNQRKLDAKRRKKRLVSAASAEAGAVADDLGFGRAPYATRDRAHLAPDVYHTDAPNTDPLQPVAQYATPHPVPAAAYAPEEEPAAGESAGSIIADAFHSFLQSDTGKVLVAQATAVLMAYVAKKVGEYLPVVKNPDLATSPGHEPETRDIDFTFHHDDADAPQHSL